MRQMKRCLIHPIVIARLRRITTIALSLIVALSMTTPIMRMGAQAQPTGGEFSVTRKDLCEFPVLIEVSGKQGVIELPGGDLIITSPALRATLTNLESGESVTLSITGTIEQTTLENGLLQRVFRGRNIFFDPLEGFVLLIGEFTGLVEVSKKGEERLIQPLEGEGEQIDLCALLS